MCRARYWPQLIISISSRRRPKRAARAYLHSPQPYLSKCKSCSSYSISETATRLIVLLHKQLYPIRVFSRKRRLSCQFSLAQRMAHVTCASHWHDKRFFVVAHWTVPFVGQVARHAEPRPRRLHDVTASHVAAPRVHSARQPVSECDLAQRNCASACAAAWTAKEGGCVPRLQE